MSPTFKLSASRTRGVISTGTGVLSPAGTTANRVYGWYANSPPGITATGLTAANPLPVATTGASPLPGTIIAQSPVSSTVGRPSAATAVNPSTWSP